MLHQVRSRTVISFYSPTELGSCIISLFSLYRLTKLRTRESKKLTPGHPVPVLFPQTCSVPSFPPPPHSNLYTTNEHFAEEAKVNLQPHPNYSSRCAAHTHSHTPALRTQTAGRSHPTSTARPDLVQGRLEQAFFTLGWRSPHRRISSPFQTC